jgi:hypothetical protein
MISSRYGTPSLGAFPWFVPLTLWWVHCNTHSFIHLIYFSVWGKWSTRPHRRRQQTNEGSPRPRTYGMPPASGGRSAVTPPHPQPCRWTKERMVDIVQRTHQRHVSCQPVRLPRAPRTAICLPYASVGHAADTSRRTSRTRPSNPPPPAPTTPSWGTPRRAFKVLFPALPLSSAAALHLPALPWA